MGLGVQEVMSMKFSDIPQFPRADYEVTVEWRDLERHIAWLDKDRVFLANPDYQRGHVWTDAQRSAFVEYGLMGGESSMVITTNCAGWVTGEDAPVELLDGLQRVTAVRMFYRNELRAFGHLCSEFEGRARMTQGSFKWRVLSLRTRADVLKQYLLMNAGGVVHSPEEIARVRKLLEKETNR